MANLKDRETIVGVMEMGNGHSKCYSGAILFIRVSSHNTWLLENTDAPRCTGDLFKNLGWD